FRAPPPTHSSTLSLHDALPIFLPYFTATTRAAGEPASWSELEQALQLAAGDDGMHFIGAAGEYDFNERGQNLRSMVTTWIVNEEDRKSTRLNSSHVKISYAVFC